MRRFVNSSTALRVGRNPIVSDASFDLAQELRRKSLHLAMVIAPLGLLVFPSFWDMVIYLGTAVALLLDTLRLRVPIIGSLFLRHLGSFARVHEGGHLLGVTWFLVACSLCVLIFPPRIATTALLFVVIGDAAAALVGKGWGRPRWWGKSLEGGLACFASCGLVGILVLDEVVVVLLGAAVATVVEILPLPIDDNLRVPLLSGAAMAAWAML
jgi:dolichol kinase